VFSFPRLPAVHFSPAASAWQLIGSNHFWVVVAHGYASQGWISPTTSPTHCQGFQGAKKGLQG